MNGACMLGRGTTYSFPIGNNGFCNVFVFHSVAKDIFVYSWAEIVPRGEVCPLQNNYMNGRA